MKIPEKRPMSRPFIRTIPWFVLVIIGMSIIPPMLFGEPRQIEGASGGDAWRNLLYDFQTMIAGFLAIGAAVATIYQMQSTDRESERRHKELLKLSLRSDALKIERLLIPQFHQLQSILPSVAKMTIDVTMPSDDEVALDKYRACGPEINDLTWYIRNILERPIWDEAAPLFGGALTYYLRELGMRIINAESSLLSLREAHISLEKIMSREKPDQLTFGEDIFRPMTQDELLDSIRSDWFSVCDNIAFANIELSSVMKCLSEIASTYEVEL